MSITRPCFKKKEAKMGSVPLKKCWNLVKVVKLIR